MAQQQLIDKIGEALALDRRRRDAMQERKRLQGFLATLSPRESQVMHLVASGRSNKEAAWELGISVKTVEIHRARLMRKLGAGSRPKSSASIRLADERRGIDGGRRFLESAAAGSRRLNGGQVVGSLSCWLLGGWLPGYRALCDKSEFVIPAKAGIPGHPRNLPAWMPAFAGMTVAASL